MHCDVQNNNNMQLQKAVCAVMKPFIKTWKCLDLKSYGTEYICSLKYTMLIDKS